MRSTSWCVLSPTMERTCLSLFIQREWEHTKTSSTTLNGMNCKSSLHFFTFIIVLIHKCFKVWCYRSSFPPLAPSKDYFPHRSSCAPAGVCPEPDSVRSAEPECQRLTRFQQTEESSRVSGQSLHAPFWLQTVRRWDQFYVALLNFMYFTCFDGFILSGETRWD